MAAHDIFFKRRGLDYGRMAAVMLASAARSSESSEQRHPNSNRGVDKTLLPSTRGKCSEWRRWADEDSGVERKENSASKFGKWDIRKFIITPLPALCVTKAWTLDLT